MTAAEAYAQSVTDPKLKVNLMNDLISTVADTDIGTALNMVNKLPVGKDQEGALRNLASTWARNDPQAAFSYASSLPPGTGQKDFMQNVASQVFQQDPASGIAMLGKISDDNLKNQVIAGVAGPWAPE